MEAENSIPTKKPLRITQMHWFEKLPSAMKMALLISGGIAAISLLGAILNFSSNLLSPSQRLAGQSVQIDSAVQKNQNDAIQPSDRNGLEKAVATAHLGVVSAIATTDEELQLARASRWWAQAQTECMKVGAGQCKSPYEWLTVQLAYWQGEVERYATTEEVSASGSQLVKIQSQKLSADAVTAAKYRRARDNYLDVAKALSLNNSGLTPRTYALSVGLVAAMESFQKSANNLEELKIQDSQAVYNGTNSIAPTQAAPIPITPTPQENPDGDGGEENAN
jgi:hypothetical protein